MTSSEKNTVVQRAAGLSDEVLESVETGRRTAIGAVRKFVDTVNEAIPALVDTSRRKTIVDAALDLADSLVTTRLEFLRSVVRSGSEAVSSKPGGTVVERAAGLSDEVLESVETGRRDAIEAVRKFVDTVNEATPALVDASRRKTIVDAVLDFADSLVTTRLEFLRSVVRSGSEAVSSKPGGIGE